ncbi:hypothetical protein KQX54_001906 [Cotesia glomerata]|uniref:Uncharacterized protein n=1 Tax=Cotesia glomerata TaxID=32391 RepID=A0AAV7I0P2_COTGL|nr:hypothetical protein KQX54_001906 [Cotesia glomerata]
MTTKNKDGEKPLVLLLLTRYSTSVTFENVTFLGMVWPPAAPARHLVVHHCVPGFPTSELTTHVEASGTAKVIRLSVHPECR